MQLRKIETPTSGSILRQKKYVSSTFKPFFEHLQQVMSSAETKAKLEPPGGPPKTPPNRETIPEDPNFTNTSTGSGTSSQGKPEEPSKLLANELIARVLDVIFEGPRDEYEDPGDEDKDDFTIVDWSESAFKLHLTAAFLPPPLPISFFQLILIERPNK
jgi:hypothetical protein